MRLEARLAKLEAVTTAAEAAYGMAYREGGLEWVYVTETRETLPADEFTRRYPAGRIVKRLIGVSPHDLA